jgi:hypothetical protein
MVARLPALVTVVLVAFAATGTDLPDPDIWWNLAEGLARLRLGGEPPVEMFGVHGCPDAQPAVSHVAVALYARAYEAMNMWGLVVVRALLVAAVALAAFASLARLSLAERSAWAACVAAALSLRASPRPELVGLALFAVACALLARVLAGAASTRPRVELAALVLVQAIAVWTHGAFMFIPLVCGAAALASAVARDRTSLRLALAALAASALGFLARPAAVVGFLHATAERAHADALALREWASPLALFLDGWRPPALGALLLLVLAAVVGATYALRRHAAPVEQRARAFTALFTLVPLLALGLDAVRALALSICAAPLFLPLLDVAPTRARRALALAAGLAAALVAASTLAVDPWLTLAATPPALAPSRTTPLGPGAFFASRQGVVYAPVHLGNWLLVAAPDVDVVWSGRRTYTPECGAALLAGRRGGAAFDAVDARLRPRWVLALHASEPALVDTLAARGFSLDAIDLRYAVFSRRGAGGRPLVVDVDALQAAETRPLDAATFRALLASTCRTLQVAAPTQAGPACDALRRLPEGASLDVSFPQAEAPR